MVGKLSMTWAQCLFKRIGYVKRKDTSAKVPISPGFIKEIGFTFYQSIKAIADTFDIPSDLQLRSNTFTILPYRSIHHGEKGFKMCS